MSPVAVPVAVPVVPERVQLAHWSQPSPIGPLLCAASPAGLALVAFGDDQAPLERLARAFGPSVEVAATARPEVAQALAAYFDGDLGATASIPLDLTLSGGWRREVLQHLSAVPPGDVVTYGELAVRAGRRGAARAVGQAVGSNPLAVVVPCHRVVASDGTLGGYAGGLARKQWLLAHEGVGARPGGWPSRGGD